MVKSRCKEKLREQALGAGILERADEYGKETLKKFFSLITGTEIKQVVFHAHRLAYYYHEIVKDDLVDMGEMILIDSLYQDELRLIGMESNKSLKERKVEHLRTFLMDLQEINAIEPGLDISFNYFSHLVTLILDDALNAQVLDMEEWEFSCKP